MLICYLYIFFGEESIGSLAHFLFIFKKSWGLDLHCGTQLFVCACGVLASCGVWAWLSLSMWDFSSLTWDQTHIPCMKHECLNPGPPGKSLALFFFF